MSVKSTSFPLNAYDQMTHVKFFLNKIKCIRLCFDRIPDPDAEKPEDWDESEPEMIPDEDAAMPDGWLEEEDELVPDPDADKPADWDEDMDGEWEPPMISKYPNTACSRTQDARVMYFCCYYFWAVTGGATINVKIRRENGLKAMMNLTYNAV